MNKMGTGVPPTTITMTSTSLNRRAPLNTDSLFASSSIGTTSSKITSSAGTPPFGGGQAPSREERICALMDRIKAAKAQRQAPMKRLMEEISMRYGAATLKSLDRQALAELINRAQKIFHDIAPEAVDLAGEVVDHEAIDLFTDLFGDTERGFQAYKLCVSMHAIKVAQRELGEMQAALEDLKAHRELINPETDADDLVDVTRDIERLEIAIDKAKKSIKVKEKGLDEDTVSLIFAGGNQILKIVARLPGTKGTGASAGQDISKFGLDWFREGVSLIGKVSDARHKHMKLTKARAKHQDMLGSESSQEESKVAHLGAKIEKLEAERREAMLEAGKKGIDFSLSTVKRGFETASKDSVSKTIRAGAATLDKLSTGIASITLVSSLLGVIWGIYDIFKKEKELEQLIEDHGAVASELNFATQDPALRKILEAKLSRLSKKRQTSRFGIFKASLKLAASSFAFCGALNTLLVAAGVTVAGTAATFFAATGIGAVVIGGLLTAIAIAKFGYKKRHLGRYLWKTRHLIVPYLKNWDQLRQANKIADVAEDRMNQLTEQAERLRQQQATLEGQAGP